MNYYIVTGTSRGIGAALLAKLQKTGNKVFSIARNENNAIDNEYTEHYSFDLTNTADIENLIDKIFIDISKEDISGLYLVNNAGTIQPIKPLHKANANEISDSLTLNAIAPAIISAAFIRHALKYNCVRRIINVSSGAGVNPYDGWSSYCSGKAALNMLTQCIAVEQQNRQTGIEIASIAPGIIETTMQEEIRSSKKEDFEGLDFFIDFKQQNKLKTPEFAAYKILDVLHSNEFKHGAFYDFIEL